MREATLNLRSIATLVAEERPEILEGLKRRFKGDANIFETEYVLGKDSAHSPGGSNGDVEALHALVRAGIEAARSSLSTAVTSLTRRIKRARQIKLAGSLIASLSSAGVISALAVDVKAAALATAIVGLLSSVATLFGEHLDQPLVGEQKGLAQYLTDALTAEAKLAEIELEFTDEAFAVREAAVVIAKKVSVLAAQVRSITVYGGI